MMIFYRMFIKSDFWVNLLCNMVVVFVVGVGGVDSVCVLLYIFVVGFLDVFVWWFVRNM